MNLVLISLSHGANEEHILTEEMCFDETIDLDAGTKITHEVDIYHSLLGKKNQFEDLFYGLIVEAHFEENLLQNSTFYEIEQ